MTATETERMKVKPQTYADRGKSEGASDSNVAANATATVTTAAVGSPRPSWRFRRAERHSTAATRVPTAE